MCIAKCLACIAIRGLCRLISCTVGMTDQAGLVTPSPQLESTQLSLPSSPQE